MFRSTLSVTYGTSNGRPGSGDRDDVHDATAAVGTAFPAFELPADTSVLNGGRNGDRVQPAVTEGA